MTDLINPNEPEDYEPEEGSDADYFERLAISSMLKRQHEREGERIAQEHAALLDEAPPHVRQAFEANMNGDDQTLLRLGREWPSLRQYLKRVYGSDWEQGIADAAREL